MTISYSPIPEKSPLTPIHPSPPLRSFAIDPRRRIIAVPTHRPLSHRLNPPPQPRIRDEIPAYFRSQGDFSRDDMSFDPLKLRHVFLLKTLSKPADDSKVLLLLL